MLFGQLSLWRADAPSGQQDQSKTTWKDMVYVILQGQPADTVMRSISLHLKTPNDHLRMLTDMSEIH